MFHSELKSRTIETTPVKNPGKWEVKNIIDLVDPPVDNFFVKLKHQTVFILFEYNLEHKFQTFFR